MRLKEALAEVLLGNRLLKKSVLGDGEREIIRTVEPSFPGVRRTLEQIGIPRSTSCDWCSRYVSEAFEAWKTGNLIPAQPGTKCQSGLPSSC